MNHEHSKVDLADIISQFQVTGRFLEGAPYGSGHINDTYAVTMTDGDAHKRYILQRINQTVFKDPKSLMENISRVTTHVAASLRNQGITDTDRRALTLIPSHDRLDYILDTESRYWRCYIFIENAATYDTPESPEQVYEAARAFGLFQQSLMDMSGPALHETIPFFHDTRQRFNRLMVAIEADPHNRAASVKKEIQFVKDHETIVDILLDLNTDGSIPTRVTHNDTKLNNVMIDDTTGEGVCVIDLDTVMPGLSLYDFGDCVRSSASTSAEDETDLSKVGVDLKLFEALTNGYLSTTRDLLCEREIELLPLSAKLITLETGIRFLTDHIDGDLYFKIHRENHNLERGRVQFERVTSMEKLEYEMAEIVRVRT